MFAGLPHFCKSGAKTPIKAPAEMIPQRVAKKFLIVVMDYPPSLKSSSDCSQFVTDKGQEGRKGVRSLRHKRIKKSEEHPFSLSPSAEPET
jgi:hypothetical protein